MKALTDTHTLLLASSFLEEGGARLLDQTLCKPKYAMYIPFLLEFHLFSECDE